MSTAPDHFISCDWGTSNFRLRVIRTDALAVLAEQATTDGVRDLNARYGEQRGADRLAFFTTFLRAKLDRLPAAYRTAAVVVSGMASSNLGMQDLPYADLPITADGAGLVYHDHPAWPGQSVRLISGVKSATGMMRGEETQALGLLSQMDPAREGVLLLPGTHSKHLSYRGGQFTDFTSFLTGELFELLSRQSILASSVQSGDWNTRAESAFREGVLAGHGSGYTRQLFGIRAGHILRHTDPTENYYRLSGLLIGEELSQLPHNNHDQVYLAGSGPILQFYRCALEQLSTGQRLTVFPPSVLEQALLAGQRKLLAHSPYPTTSTA